MSQAGFLLLFDIDGTLMQMASREHAAALRGAAEQAHGVSLDGIRAPEAAGRTDGEIARLLLLQAGVSPERIDERAEEVRDECCRLYAELCPADLSDKVVAGVPDVLAWLAERDDARLALVTGNFEPVARIKLKHAGLGHWFVSGQGGFGSDSEDRTALPPIARRRAGTAAERESSWPQAKTVVIGDTPRDIACARADDAHVIAVTSGPYGAEELYAADTVATDAVALRRALQSLLG
jgi:phosphoglycolate phosphatase-like HAD superfamily hydrolase